MTPEVPVVEAPAKAEESSNGANMVVKAMRNVLMAAIGTVALGIEEVEAIVNHLIEKGELAEKDGRAMITEVMERRPKDVTKVDFKFEGVVDKRVEAILSRMNVPNRSDIELLSGKITDLSQKVDDLTKKLSA